MALTPFAFELLVPHLRRAKRVLCLGHPDLLETPARLLERYGIRAPVVDHGLAHKVMEPVADALAVFSALGVEDVEIVDVKPHPTAIVHFVDLNTALSLGAPSRDLVIDPGTIEHCANAGHALMIAASAVARGGAIYHCSPLTMLNHGYYNLCPALFQDFYEQNGWVVQHQSVFRVTPPDFSQLEAVNLAVLRTRWAPPTNSAMHTLALRPMNSSERFQWPRQFK